MALLEVSGLSKSFDTVKAVDGVSFAAERGEILCLLGPSGCGKTTLLRLIAGIEEPDEGNVASDGESLSGVPPQQRGFGLMFQDLALFPHMDVFGNVAFGLRMQRLRKEAVRERVHSLLALVDMAEYAGRRVHELSGGERQRVALARSLAPAPRVLMLDEPLGALDRALRDSLQGQVRAILKEVGVASIYVTHDRDEAFAMADRLLCMNRGRIVQIGTPEEVFGAPVDEFVARSLGFKNIMPGVVRSGGEFLEIECAVGVFSTLRGQALEPADGQEAMFLIEENGVTVHRATDKETQGKNVLSGTVVERVFRGGGYELKVSVGQGALFCAGPPDDFGAGLHADREVSLVIDPAAVKFLEGP
jgi:ABC-type Fe3+/spermidine/putrescine transport system ATPase subunit